MAEKLLTESVVRRAKNGTGNQCFVWDSEVPGFGIRIYGSGRKTFVFRRYEAGRRIIDSLGQWGVLDVETARKAARELLLREVLAGHQIQPSRTLEAVCMDYLNGYAKQHKRTWEADCYNLYRHVFPTLGHRAMHEIGRRDLELLHAKLSDKPYRANRVIALLSSIWTKAIEWGEVEENPARGIRMNREFSRDVFLTVEQLPMLLRQVEKEPPQFRAIIELLLLTGLRKQELLSLRWADVLFEERMVRVGHTKNGTVHHLPLTVQALRVFEQLPKEGVYVFEFRGKKLGDFKKRWARVRKDAGMNHLRVHDLRRTVGSWLAQQGHSLHLIGEVLNHKDPRATKVYARFQKDDVRKALEELKNNFLAP